MNRYWRTVVLYIAVIGIEGCWLYALMAMLNKQVAGERLHVFGILLLYPVSFGLNRLLRRLRLPGFLLQSVSWLLWVAAVLLTVKIQLMGSLAWSDTGWLLAIPRAFTEIFYKFEPELLILASTAVIWWMGRRLAHLAVNFSILVGEFQFGMFILVIALFVASQLGADVEHAVFLIVAFFFFSLLGISLAHAIEGTSWLSGLYQGHWLGLLLASIGLVLIVGFIISLLVTPDLLQLIVAALKWVWNVIMTIIEYLLSLLPEQQAPEVLPEMPAMPAMENPDEEFRLWRIPDTWRSGIRIGWSVVMLGFLVFALWRISTAVFRWIRRKLAGTAGAEFEPMPGAFRADLMNFLRRIFSKLLGIKRLFHRGDRAGQASPEINTVRQIYRQFLRWAAAAGFPRQIAQTPHEYLYALSGTMPEFRGDMTMITRHYVRTRYGAGRVTEDDLHQMRQSWYNVKHKRAEDGSKKGNGKNG